MIIGMCRKCLQRLLMKFANIEDMKRLYHSSKWWINDDNPNVIRAVTEGLGIWTSRPYFKENPSVAIALITKHKVHESKYLRKSVGNALRDISKKHAELIRQEVEQWDLSNPRIMFTYKLAAKLLK